MKVSDLRSKTVEELQQDLLALTKDNFGFRMQQSTGQLSQPHLLKAAKKDIARVKTLLRDKKVSE